MNRRILSPIALLSVVPISGCLRRSLFPRNSLPFTALSMLPCSTQVRTQVTQVKVPKPQKKEHTPVKPSPTKAKDSATKATAAKGSKGTEAEKKEYPNEVDWSQIDLSEVSLPPPRHPEPQLHYEDGRTFYKHPHSRKVYLHTLYTNLLLRHPILLFFNINSVDFHTLIHLRNALTPHGAEFKVIRRRIFLSALRVAQYVEQTRPQAHELWDPSGLAMHARILPRKRNVEELEMKSLLKGHQPCAIYFNDFNWRPESIDPVKVAAVIRIVERTGKTPILGARFQRTVATPEDVQKLRMMESVGKVRGELVGVLGGAAQTLVGTLSTPAGGLAFTLEGRQKAMEEEQGVSSK